MAEKKYSSCPIVEAVINIQFQQDKGFDSAQINEIRRLLEPRFPTVSPIHLFEFNMGVVPQDMSSEERRSAPRQTEVGLRFASTANDRVLQIQQGNFTFSHLPPYKTWRPFCDEAAELWNRISSGFPNLTVSRVATRYINKIVIPSDSVEMSDYFHLYPEIPKGIPQAITGMLVQLQMPQMDIGDTTAVVNLALTDSGNPSHLAVVLDIDLFTGMSALPSDSPAIWEQLEKSRQRKNELFESFITDETRKLFQ